MSDRFPDLDFWRKKYQEDHTPWDLGETSSPVRYLVDNHFPPTGKVLIPGCGRGHEAVYLARRGYSVTAVDYAPEALDYLRQEADDQGASVEILQQDILAPSTALERRFDVLLEQTCLGALHPDQWQDYERMAFRTLRKGGQLMGVFMEVAVENPPPFNCAPHLVRELFDSERWEFQGMEPMPRNPNRPGPEYIARFLRRG